MEKQTKIIIGISLAALAAYYIMSRPKTATQAVVQAAVKPTEVPAAAPSATPVIEAMGADLNNAGTSLVTAAKKEDGAFGGLII